MHENLFKKLSLPVDVNVVCLLAKYFHSIDFNKALKKVITGRKSINNHI